MSPIDIQKNSNKYYFMEKAKNPFEREGIRYQSPSPSSYPRTRIESLATDLREIVGYTSGDDLQGAVAILGGRIHTLPFEEYDSTEAGSILVHAEKDFDIFISNFTGVLRDRFTICHELGHYLLHSYLDKKKSIKAKRYGSGPVEWEANWFSAAFLMPRDEFLHVYHTSDSLMTVASYFKVSLSAASVRLESLSD